MEDDENNVVEKEMEGTYVGTNIEESHKTTSASDLPTSTLLIQNNVIVRKVIMMKMETTMYIYVPQYMFIPN